MDNISQMSLLEVAVALAEQKHGKQNIHTLIKEVLEMKGVDDDDFTLTSQLYNDITASSKFVYMGNDEWDLKARQSLDEFDKDGSAFNSKFDEFAEDIDDDLDEDDLDDDELDDEEDDLDDDDDTDSSRIVPDVEEEEEVDEVVPEVEDDLDDAEPTERYSEEDEDFDEDEYNDLMDNYEGMYDEN